MKADLFIETNLPLPLNQEQLYSYFRRMYAGDKIAREEIIKHNIRLVLYRVENKFFNVPYDKKELVSIGITGLMKSVDSFDITKEREFATYAVRGIDFEILSFMKKEQKHFYNDSLDRTVSMDKLDKNIELKDLLFDETIDIVSDYEEKESHRIIRKIVFELPEREKEIIIKYFGFLDDNPMTQKEISDFLGLSQSYVSRIINKVLNEIKIKLQQEEIIDFPTQAVKKKNIYDKMI